MFAPLALTQALPYLPLAQGSIDYQVERRADPGLIDRTLRQAGGRGVLTRYGLLAVPLGQRNAAAQPHARMRLATLPGAYVADALASHPHVVAMYLGEVAGAHPERIVALDISAVDAVPPAARAVDAAFDERGDAAGGPAVLESAVQRFAWVDLRACVPRASGRVIGVATTMLSLANWFAYQTHCPACGAPTRPAMSGWAQRCTNGDDGHRLLFPRVEPAVIMTVVDSQDRLLLQHNRARADPPLLRRETKEQTCIEVVDVKYLGSQPWPFKISLMMAFKGQALSTRIQVDGEEVTDARWVTRDEFTDLLVTGRISAPGKATIARYMIEEWYGRSLD